MAILCSACSTEWPEGFRFCGACGAPLDASTEAAKASRRVVTALFCDVVGSTTIGEANDPERARAVMDRYFAIAREVIERQGGTVEKFIGDAVMAVFGWPTQFEDDALRAVRSGLEIHSRLAAAVAPADAFAVRVGLGTGEVVAMGGSTGGTFVTGDAVNSAARLEQAAGAGETVIDAATYGLVRHAVTAESLGSQVIRGRSAGLDAYRILSLDAAAEAVPRDLASPLIGRESELTLIRRVYARVRTDQQSAVVTILAEPGTGKSRLVHEALADMRKDAIVMRGRCSASGGAALSPFGDALLDAAGAGADGAGESARSRLVGLVADAPDGPLLGPRLAALAGLEALRIPPEESVWVARRTLAWLSRSIPVVVVLDDLQWAQPGLLDMIETVMDRLPEAPVLFLAIARPELLDSRPEWFEGRDRAQRLHLEALPTDLAGTLLDRLAPALRQDPDTRNRVLAAADGNPLFVEQFAAMLDGAGATSSGALEVPSTVSALLGARLDGLGARQRGVIQRASIAGKRFWWGALSQISPETDRAHLSRNLGELVRRDFILADRSEFPGDEAFRFKHLLIRDAAYAQIPKAERARLHERFAAWLTEHTGAAIDPAAELVAFHLEQAIRYRAELGAPDADDDALSRRASSIYAEAGLAAFDRNDMVEATRLLGRAASLLQPDDVRRIGLEFRLAKALQQHGDHEQALALVDHALERARRSGDVALVERGALWRRDVLQLQGSGGREGELRAVIRFFEISSDLEGMALAWQHLSYLWIDRSRFGEALKAVQKSLDLARRAGDIWLEMRSTALMATIYAEGPTPIPVAIRRSGALLANMPDDRRLRVNVLRAQASLLASAARFDEVGPVWNEVESITRELSVPWENVVTTVLGASIASLSGRDAEAVETLRAIASSVHGRANQASLADTMARSLLALGRDDEALELVRRVKPDVADLESQVFTALVEADIVARQGNQILAVELLVEALDLFRGSDALCLVAAALTMAGRVRIHLGDQREAQALLEGAIKAADAKGEAVWRSRAVALLATFA
ncbi:MAG TPA: AAA family ATPase [Solirubrobacterales bacterium]